MNRPVLTFVRHYVEMLLAMAAGMLVLYPAWLLAVGPPVRPDVDVLVMATTMAVPMAAWMRYRGHRPAPTLEMSLAMYAGFAVPMPWVWAGALDSDGLMTLGHVLMLAFMLVAMLARRSEYTGRCPVPAR